MFALPTVAQASWGNGSHRCSKGSGHHCYAFSEGGYPVNTYAVRGFQDTHYSTVYDCANEEGQPGTGGFVDDEMWVTPKSKDGLGYLEVGQLVGRGYCDQRPHVFLNEISPSNPEVEHMEVSSLPTVSNQYNMYAISDIPYKDGEWFIYYRIPSESSVWTEARAFGGGWGDVALEEESGMEAATNIQPSFEGSTNTANTNVSITPFEGWTNWTGVHYFAEAGNTCINPLGNGEGNADVAACG
jgi:hypothetical protein